MPTGTLSITAIVNGESLAISLSRTAAGRFGQAVTVAAAKPGSLTTRTDDNTGVATLSTGHGIITNDIVDVYWTGGVRRGMTATVATNAVTIDGGTGDNLPASTTAVNLCKVTVLDADFDGDLLEFLAMRSDKRAQVSFVTSAPAEIAGFECPALSGYAWVSENAVDNPLAGQTIDAIRVSNGDSTASATVKIEGLYNSDE